WRAAVESGRFPASWEETPVASVRLGETWWLGLRTNRGIDPRDALAASGFAGPDPTQALRSDLGTQGFLASSGSGRWRLTERGWPVADAIARRFLEACASGAS